MSERRSRRERKKKERDLIRLFSIESLRMKSDVRILIKSRGVINRLTILLKDRIY